MDWRYLPRNRNGRLSHLMGEASEVIGAISLINRFGGNSAHPDKEKDEVKNPNNVGLLLMELWDLDYAMRACLPDIVHFLGEDLVKQLRTEWETKAVPPPSEEAVQPKAESFHREGQTIYERKSEE